MISSNYLDSAIDWMKKHGYNDIKANHEDFEKPNSFNRKGEEEPVIPDITGVKTGGKSFLEIATKTDEVRQKVTKWMLLSTMAARKGGKLILLTPKGHKSFTENIVKQYNLDARVVSI